MRADRSLRFGSLFSGVGGFDMGLEAAGWKCAWQVEIDPKAASVLRHRWPDVPLHADVNHVGRTNLAPVDLICGGFPCQDLSVVGKRAGLAGERSGLFHEFMRVVDELAPRWVLIENVPGLLSSNRGRDMGTVLSSLAQFGYGWTYRCLDTQYFGPPQRRRRVFIVGCAGGVCPPEVLLEPESLSGNPAPCRKAREEVARAIAPSLAASGRGVERAGESRGQDPVVVGVPDPAYAVTGGPNGNQFGTGRDAQDTFALVAAPTLHQRTTNADAAYPIQASDARKLEVGVLTTAVPRRLTPRECERLQGWPDDWTRWGRTPEGEVIELSDSARYRMAGNGVTGPVAEWIGRRILDVAT